MSTATKLKIFRAALSEVGDRTITDTGDDREAVRVCVERYDDVVADCLQEASWNFAMETVKLDADTGVTPEFGSYTEVFAKPADWVQTHGVSADEDFNLPLEDYVDEVHWWSAAVTPIYVKYVSNDTGMGLELSRWPRTFTRFVELALADRILPRINQDEKIKTRIKDDLKMARKNAKNKDAWNEKQTKYPPQGSWSRSRGGRSGNSRDMGRRNSFTG